MRPISMKMRSTAIAALFSLPIAGGTALAQEQQSEDQQAQEQQAQEQQSQDQQSGTDAAGEAAADEQPDAVVATVGDAEIRSSDVMTVIGLLPPQLQSQPAQMLVPMALEQLILRELILEEARAQNLAADPDVVALAESAGQTAQDDAMVQVWLEREMASAVTDESVQQVYDQAQGQAQEELPPVDQLRPQIEQFLRQQAMQQIQTQLREGADVVFYDLSGEPVEQQPGDQQPATAQTDGGDSTDPAAGEGATEDAFDDASGNQPSDEVADPSEETGDETDGQTDSN